MKIPIHSLCLPRFTISPFKVVYPGVSGLLGAALVMTLNLSHASAQVNCADLPGPQLVILHGDTQSRMIADLGRVLRDAEEPLTIVHLSRSTCSLVSDVFSGAPVTFTMQYEPSQAEDPDWNGTPLECITDGLNVDVGIAATFVSSCSQSVLDTQPDDVAIFRGPVQAYGFIVPEGTLDVAGGAITREEAYFVFSGQGAAANAVPWTAEPDPAPPGVPSLYIRRSTTSTLLTCASNVEPELLPPDRWVGYRLEGQDDRSSIVINGVANAPAELRNSTIGILGVELYDRQRDVLDLLAYQAEGQRGAYYPDSTPSRRDKRNVRDGHYVPWSYTEYLAYVDEDGDVINPHVQRLLDIVSGVKEVRIASGDDALQSFDMDALQVIAGNGLIPECAMSVTRQFDGSDLSLYTPDNPCGCFFETVQDPEVVNDPEWQASCPTCNETQPCSSGTCNRGYCEVTP